MAADLIVDLIRYPWPRTRRRLQRFTMRRRHDRRRLQNAAGFGAWWLVAAVTASTLRLATAAADGLDPDVIARLRFAIRSTSLLRAALPALALQITEMHLIDAQDAKPSVTVLPVVVTP